MKYLKHITLVVALFTSTVNAGLFSNEFELGEYKGEPALIMNGVKIDTDTGRSIWKMMYENPKVKTVVLGNSLGGDTDVAIYISKLIRKQQLNTVVVGGCESACAWIWLGGVERTFDGENAYLGYHQTTVYLDSCGLLPTFGEETQKARKKVTKFMKEMNAPEHHMQALEDGTVLMTSKVYN